MKPIAVDDFANFKYLSNVTFSPKGENLCMAVTNANMEKNRYESNLYYRKDGQFVRLTAGNKEGSFLYLNETTVLFPGDREESKSEGCGCKYYSISLEGGEAVVAYTFPIPVSNIKVLKNGDFLVSGTNYPGYEDLYLGDEKLAKKYKDETKENEDYEEITENPWWWNGGTYTKAAYQSVFYYDSRKKKLKRLTAVDFSVSDFKVTADEKYVFYLGTERAPYVPFYTASLYRLELATGKVDTVFTGTKDLFYFDMEMGEHFAVVLLSKEDGVGCNANPDFYKLNPETLELTEYAKLGEAVGTSVGADIRYGGGKQMKMVGDVLYFISTQYDDAKLYKLEDGIISVVLDKAGSVDCFDACEGEIAMVALFDMKGQELYDRKGKQLTHFNDKVLRGKYVAKPEPLNVISRNTEIHGFVLKPFDYDETKKYPVIYDIHGGPKTVYGPVYYHEMQYWAGKGYFVIFCNPVGSDGRGNAFMDIMGKYGTIDYEDLMAFCDKALDTYPQMDREHVYETGGSYGGFMTNWIIGHTDRFKACASQRSISNWFSFYGVSDIGVMFVDDQNQADPWKNPEKLWWHSPMKYADQVKTPTLFLHSLEDYRCPVDQAYQMCTSLVSHGVDTKLVLFKGENHDLSRTGKPKHRLKRLHEITGWFEKHQ